MSVCLSVCLPSWNNLPPTGRFFFLNLFFFGGGGGISSSRLRDHIVTLHSVGILWTIDQPDAETSTWHHATLPRDSHALSGFRIRSRNKRTVADPRLSPRRHWDLRVISNGIITFDTKDLPYTIRFCSK